MNEKWIRVSLVSLRKRQWVREGRKEDLLRTHRQFLHWWSGDPLQCWQRWSYLRRPVVSRLQMCCPIQCQWGSRHWPKLGPSSTESMIGKRKHCCSHAYLGFLACCTLGGWKLGCIGIVCGHAITKKFEKRGHEAWISPYQLQSITSVVRLTCWELLGFFLGFNKNTARRWFSVGWSEKKLKICSEKGNERRSLDLHKSKQ